jgi:hypothetical protein
MPRYIIHGAFRDSGKPIKAVVDAADADAASALANRKGILVETTTLEAPATEIVVKRTEVATRPPPVPVTMQSAAPKPWMVYVGEGQDAHVVERLYKQVMGVMTPQEDLAVLVVQKKPLVNLSPDALAATTRRAILYRTKLLGGMVMDDFLWSRLSDAKIAEGMLGATVSFSVVGLGFVSMDHLPKAQARAFYRFAQQQEEGAMVSRRQFALEEARAAAGGVTVNNLTQPFMSTPSQPPPVPSPLAAENDPVSRIRSLKSLLDSGLIEQSEFDAKKAEILKAL